MSDESSNSKPKRKYTRKALPDPTQSAKTFKKPGPKVWREDLLLDIYEMTRDGKTEVEIQEHLHARGNWAEWKEEHPIDEAMQRAAERRNRGFQQKILESISEPARQLYLELQNIDRSDLAQLEILRHRVSESDEVIQMQLFAAVLEVRNFNMATACRECGIPRSKVMQWEKDSKYRNWLEEIRIQKKDFASSKLYELVDEKEPMVTWKVNTSLNPEEFRDKSEVITSGQVQHVHSVIQFDFNALMQLLPLDTQMIVWEAYTKMNAEPPKVIEGEVKALPPPRESDGPI